MVQREVFFFENTQRLHEFLSGVRASGESLESVVGVGLFAGQAAPPPHEGLELVVSPPFLKPQLLAEIGRGRLHPLSYQPLFLGASEGWSGSTPSAVSAAPGVDPEVLSTASIKRWILLGIHPVLLFSNKKFAEAAQFPAEYTDMQSIEEGVAVLLRGLFNKVMGLRASAVLFLLDSNLLRQFFQEIAQWRQSSGSSRSFQDYLDRDEVAQKSLLLREIVSWIAEEVLHPKVAVLCENTHQWRALMADARHLLLKSPACRDVMFRI